MSDRLFSDYELWRSTQSNLPLLSNFYDLMGAVGGQMSEGYSAITKFPCLKDGAVIMLSYSDLTLYDHTWLRGRVSVQVDQATEALTFTLDTITEQDGSPIVGVRLPQLLRDTLLPATMLPFSSLAVRACVDSGELALSGTEALSNKTVQLHVGNASERMDNQSFTQVVYELGKVSIEALRYQSDVLSRNSFDAEQ
jgi:hypothetical protein